MNRLVGVTLIGLLVGAAISAGIAKPTLAHPSQLAATITVQAATSAPPVQAGAAAHPARHPTVARPQVLAVRKPATSPRVVNPDANTPACTAGLHGIVGPECPSR